MTLIRRAASGAALAALAVAAGCGEDSEEPAPAPVPASGSGDIVIAALGDSITAGNPGYDPDPGARAAYGFGAEERSSYEFWAAEANPEVAIRNCGVFGERTDEIAARLEPCAEGADGIVIQGGINDIAQGYEVERAAQNLRNVVEAAKEMDLDVAIADVLPWNNGHPAADPRIEALNLLIAEIAFDKSVPLLRFHDTLEDPDARGRMRAEWTADGDHPSVEGYRRLGELAFKLPSR